MSPIMPDSFSNYSSKTLKTPLKASVVLLTAVILASCSSDGSDSNITNDSTPIIKPTPDGDSGDDGEGSGDGDSGTGGEVGGNEGSDDGSSETAAEKAIKEAQEARAEAESKAKEAQAKAKAAEEAKAKAEKASKAEIAAAEKAAQEAKDKADQAAAEAKAAKDRAEAAEAKAKSEAAKALAAAKAREIAEAATKKAQKAKEDAIKAKNDAIKAKEVALKAKKEAEDALAAGDGGSSEALQAEANRKAELAKQAQTQAENTAKAAQAAAAAAEAKAAAATKAAKDSAAALAAAQIKNAPEVAKSGVQSLNVNVAPLNKVYNTTTRDFSADDNSVIARADIASESEPGAGDGLLGKLPITTSGDGDTDVAGSNGFKAHDDSTEVSALGQKLPLTYTSVYKDYEDDMRIGHIDGNAVLALNPTDPAKLPVNGVAVVGNATQDTNMPNEGQVNYTGDATYRQLGLDNDIEFGQSAFTADFVAKNLKGNLAFDKAGKIGLTATIDGNQFSGTATNNAGFNTEGGFFGGDAQYLGGVYEGNGAQGTYGAKSDKQTAAEQAAQDAQAQATAANKALKDAQAQAAASAAEANKAKEDAIKAQAAAAQAQKAADNAGDSEAVLEDAIARAAAAEEAEAKALKAAETAEVARVAALKAQTAAENALKAEKDAAKLAIGEAKADAEKRVEEARAAETAAKIKADDAKIVADKAIEDANNAETAKKDALNAKAKIQEALDKAKQELQQAQQDVKDAQREVTTATNKATEAEKVLGDAKAEIERLKDELASSGGGNTDALEAQLAEAEQLKENLQTELTQAQQAVKEAQTAAQAQLEAANQAANDARDALEAATIKNTPEAKKSGVQSINIDPSGAGVPVVFKTTTRDFEINEGGSVVDARADMASVTSPDQPGLLPAVAVTISGANDTDAENGFKAHEDSTDITTNLGVLPLTYTSTYKDFGDDMRIGHIDGDAVLALDPDNPAKLPVNGVALVGNATKADNMPTEGKVGYTGDATYRKLGIGNAIEFGTSVFTADFVAKNVKGDLTFDKAGTIGLTASINGNEFSGSADANGGYLTEGGFFGGDGQYLGGVYEGNGAQGTYGAKSDKQIAADQAAVDAQAAAKAAQKEADAAKGATEAAKKLANQAQSDLAAAQVEIERIKKRIENAGSGNDALLEELNDALEAAKQAAKDKDDALAQLSVAQTTITELQVKVDGLKGDNAQLQAELAQAKKELQAQIESLKSDNKDLQGQAEDLQKELNKLKPDAPENIEYAADTKLTGVQSNKISGYKGKDGSAKADSQGGYKELTIQAQDLDTDYVRGSFDVILKGIDDTAYKDAEGKEVAGFKVHKGTGKDTVPGTSTGGVGSYKRDLNYTSVYNKFADMQIGHVYGDIPSTAPIQDAKLSTVYVNGNATASEDMEYMQKLAAHNLQHGLQNGEGIDSGKVKYAGVSTYQKNGDYNGLVTGTSEFKVDFVNHQLDGNLAFKGTNIANKKIKAEIEGNKFSGNWNGTNTEGGFFGQDAALLGGLYQDSAGKGTYGAEKGKELPGSTEADMTGFQSTTLSSIEQNVAGTQLENAIGYVEIRNDKSDFTTTELRDGSVVPVDNQLGDNFNSFDSGVVRADMVKPDNVGSPLPVSLIKGGSVTVDAGKGSFNPKFEYSAVYQNFESQMQVGHVYGNFNSALGDVSRAANVYVQGYATTKSAMAELANVNDGTAKYTGEATYIENIHLADNASTAPVRGKSAFNVDFVDGSVDGTLTFAEGNYKYMPAGNEIGISATIDGNTFAGNVNGVDTAGGFYGDDAQFLGGIYQDASVQGGKGTVAGTGTTFQGTFGAEKVAK